MTQPSEARLLPIGRRVIVKLLPEPPRSALIDLSHIAPDAMTRRAVVVGVGATCRNVTPGETVVARIAVGTIINDELILLPEEACVATISEASA